MVSFTWEARESGGVALVAGVCRTDSRVDRLVRLRPAGSSPVRRPRIDPPRVRWVDGVARVRVPAGGATPLGFAVEAPASDPPATVASDEPVPEGSERIGVDADSPAAVARALPSPAPPPGARPDRLDTRPTPAVRAWLDRAERRLATAPPGGAPELARRLKHVAERAETLAGRAAAGEDRTGMEDERSAAEAERATAGDEHTTAVGTRPPGGRR